MFDIELTATVENYQDSNIYYAEVINVEDKLNLNRIQIKIFGMTDDIPNEFQPWCDLQFPNSIITYPNINDKILIILYNRDIFKPIYLSTIYTSKNIKNEDKYKEFTKDRNITNKEIFTTALKNVNNLTNNDPILVKTSHCNFNNTLNTSEDIFSEIFKGSETINLYSNIKSGFNVGDKFYPWYHLESGNDWKNILGGWSFYTENEINNGSVKFPDSFRNINYKRYRTWLDIKNKYGNDAILQGGFIKEALFREKSWDFIPTLPWVYWQPEMLAVFSEEEKLIYLNYFPSFPFGKMKIENRKNYKQHNILSPDGKSVIELDDNEGCERLKIDFNYGEMGIEFSKAGMNGLEIWSTGTLRGWFAGENSNGEGGVIKNPNWLYFADSEFRLHSDLDTVLTSEYRQFFVAKNDITIRSKNGNIIMTPKNNFLLMSPKGFDNLGKNEYVKDTEGTWFGHPILRGPATHVDTKTSGWFIHMPTENFKTPSDANKFINALNGIFHFIKEISNAVGDVNSPDFKAFAFMGATKFLEAAIKLNSILNENWNPLEKNLNIEHLCNSYENFYFEGGGTIA